MTLLAEKGLAPAAESILRTSDPVEKTSLSRKVATEWQTARDRGDPIKLGVASPPDFPARPAHPVLKSPRDVPRRRPGTPAGRIALLHAVAHIELNAVDLHWDIVARFSETPLPLGFFDDWVRAADEESKHFGLVAERLQALGSNYGALDAHSGMWQAAHDTSQDLMARLAIVPMVLEARGLDVTPGMIEIFKKANDEDSVSVLSTIYAEEVGHVAYGSKWFHFLCGRKDVDPKTTFHELVRTYFRSDLKPPFNEEKRAEAGIPMDFYWPLSTSQAVN